MPLVEFHLVVLSNVVRVNEIHWDQIIRFNRTAVTDRDRKVFDRSVCGTPNTRLFNKIIMSDMWIVIRTSPTVLVRSVTTRSYPQSEA
jgi:hypothetical protein